MQEHLERYIEALIFSAELPIKLGEIVACLESAFSDSFSKKQVQLAIEGLMARYQEEQYSFELLEIAEGYQFLTKSNYYDLIGVYLKQKSKKKLSRSALETLAIIAYQQPVSKSEIERLRGVSCDYAVQKLLEKELIEIKGRSTDPGRPLLYGVSSKFMEHFGLSSMKDLPKLKEFKLPENAIGEAEKLI
ncbi:segregation and condensation protein B [Saprospira grandis DSM 2844]|uniref:Segregation and condensation protein B n=1 Tax=Saprospira grandis DSM 2844 TaxID=694433 RepID=J1I6M4_9BACT|nr:SMC-Scp complex subunit ScpB [Saprospira grandis]EJF54450.1 segregation and condensation protein B [Saprospira grandis DSM 2844]